MEFTEAHKSRKLAITLKELPSVGYFDSFILEYWWILLMRAPFISYDAAGEETYILTLCVCIGKTFLLLIRDCFGFFVF